MIVFHFGNIFSADVICQMLMVTNNSYIISNTKQPQLERGEKLFFNGSNRKIYYGDLEKLNKFVFYRRVNDKDIFKINKNLLLLC